MTQRKPDSGDVDFDTTSFNKVMEGVDSTTQTIDLSSLFVSQAGADDGGRHSIKLAVFGRLLQALSVPTLLIGRSHAVKFANAAFMSLFPDPFSLDGFTFASLFPTPKEARQAQLLLEKVFNDRKPIAREKLLQIHKTKIWGRIHLRTIRFGRRRLALAQVENLTAQKELVTIEKYKKLVNILPIGVVELAVRKPLPCYRKSGDRLKELLNARVVDGNNEFARMYKRNTISAMVGVPLGMLLPSEGKAQILYKKWIDRGFPTRSFNTRESGLSEGTLYFENTLIANINNQHLHGFWWLKRDISDKKRMEEEILNSNKLEALGTLAGGIAHDFNNLLTGILGNVSLAQLHLNKEDKAFERLEAAAKAAFRAQDLTRQLLTFSKGGAPIKRSASVGELLRETATFVLRGSNVRCEFNVPQNLWVVEVDRGQISQVVNNLVLNAVQAMPKGGEIQLRAANVVIRDDDPLPLDEGKYVRVSIVDRGVGIPREHLQRIFDPYFTTKEEGTGLGLAISYSIMKRHEGIITVESEVGAGTTFHLFLPAKPDPSAPAHGVPQPKPESKGRILVMDDEEIIRDLVTELLDEEGYEVTCAVDGEEALRMYGKEKDRGKPFDAVIMDLTVPGGMGGREAVVKLLRIDPDVKAVVSSGYSNDPIMSDYARYGFKGVLPKPYDSKQLIAMVERILKEDADA